MEPKQSTLYANQTWKLFPKNTAWLAQFVLAELKALPNMQKLALH